MKVLKLTHLAIYAALFMLCQSPVYAKTDPEGRVVDNLPVAKVLGLHCDHFVEEPGIYEPLTLPSGERYPEAVPGRIEVIVIDGARVETVREVVRALKRKRGRILNCDARFKRFFVQFPRGVDVGRIIDDLRKRRKDNINGDPVTPPLRVQGEGANK